MNLWFGESAGLHICGVGAGCVDPPNMLNGEKGVMRCPIPRSACSLVSPFITVACVVLKLKRLRELMGTEVVES
jgi:hypothetical protein